MQGSHLAIAIALSGCVLARPYPPASDEDTAELCENREDDDLDGRVDCADDGCRAHCGEGTRALCRNGIDDDESGASDCDDPSCAGMCPEEAPARCANGIDEDGDGLVDRDDPSCWPSAPLARTRCTSQAGGAWHAEFEGIDDGWLVSDGGTAEYVDDPTGLHARQVLALPTAFVDGRLPVVTNAAQVTGGVDGLRFEARLYLPDVVVELGVESPAVPPAGAPKAVALQISQLGAVGYLAMTGETFAHMELVDRDTGWYDLVLEVDDTALTVTITLVGERTGRTFRVAHGGALFSGAPMRFYALQHDVIPGTVGALLASASLTRPGVDPCGEPIPPPLDPRHGTVLLAAASSGPVLCALAGVDRLSAGRLQLAARGFRSDDGGRTFRAGFDVLWADPHPDGGFYAPSITIAWSPEASEFVGVGRAYERASGADRVALVRSPDCIEWTVEDVVDPPAWPPSPTYSIVSAAGGSTTHELWQIVRASDGSTTLERFWSEGALRADTVLVRDRPLALPPSEHLWLGAIARGRDLLLSAALGDAFLVAIADREVLEPRDWVAVQPTRIDGACDAGGLYGARLFLDGPTTGGLLHSCRTDPRWSQLVVQRLEVGSP